MLTSSSTQGPPTGLHHGVLRGLQTAAVVVLLALGLAACSNNSTPSASTTSSPSTAITHASAGSEPTTTSTTGSSGTAGTLVPQTASGTEFYSPSKNISCEIDDNFGPSSLTQTLCLTLSPAKSVVLKTDGSLTECSGQQCLSNAGENTPTLPYGNSITLGPFTCQSSSAGIKCLLASGAGFLISSSGITAQGNAQVAAGST
jgi:hypothetical protein